MRKAYIGCASFFALALTLGGGASAQISQSMSTSSDAASRAYWTPARLEAARPIEAQVEVDLNAPATPSAEQVGQNPPKAYFTTSRVIPKSSLAAYPWRAVGKLFFRDQKTGKDHTCTGAVLKPRLVVTAGQCVAHAAANSADRYFYSNFLFVPAYEPRQSTIRGLDHRAAWVTNAWFQSNGTLPNPQDVALLVLRDREINGSLKRIGVVTGMFAHATNSVHPQNITELGFAGNLDGGEQMSVTFAESFGPGTNNTVIIGSGMRSSPGAPWIKDFGASPAGLQATSRNQIVSVTSYGPTGAGRLYPRFAFHELAYCRLSDSVSGGQLLAHAEQSKRAFCPRAA